MAAWWVVYGTTSICLRQEHPFRVYWKGLKHTALQAYLEVLRHATGPRMSSRARTSWAYGVLAALVILCGGASLDF